MANSNIHPEFHRFLRREDKETLLEQRGGVVWLYGLSGSGKSTIANILERQLHKAGRMTVILDGDNMRSGLNADLTFTDEDRDENVRRVAEVSKIFANQGILTLVSVITPLIKFRDVACDIIGENDFLEVYVDASFETCKKRDVKGLYAKADMGELISLTGKDSGFEIPENPEIRLDTDQLDVAQCVDIVTKALEAKKWI